MAASSQPGSLLRTFRSTLGWMAACWGNDCLRGLVFGHGSRSEAVDAARRYLRAGGQKGLVVPRPQQQTSEQPQLEELVERLLHFAEGAEDDFGDVELDLSWSTAFQHGVIQACRSIPFGQTCSYADLARRAGFAGAARAVGQVMASNRFPLIVPCHRVVGSGGSLGGFSSPRGLDMKRLLLAREGHTAASNPARRQSSSAPRSRSTHSAATARV